MTQPAFFGPIPKWIFFYGCVLAVISLGTGLIGLFAPTMFFSDFPDFDTWDEITFVTNTFGIRNLALSAGMVLALYLRQPAAIAIIFAIRCLVETGDILNTMVTGHGTNGLPVILLVVIGLALFIIPEALAAIWGVRKSITAPATHTA